MNGGQGSGPPTKRIRSGARQQDGLGPLLADGSPKSATASAERVAFADQNFQL
jgi:hypothetical protein